MEIFVHPTCTSCRKAEAFLASAGIGYARRDFFRDRFARQELAALLARVGLRPSEVLSVRSRVYRDLGLADRTLSDAEMLELMVAEPTLLRRPLTVSAGRAVVGFDRAALMALIGR